MSRKWLENRSDTLFGTRLPLNYTVLNVARVNLNPFNIYLRYKMVQADDIHNVVSYYSLGELLTLGNEYLLFGHVLSI